MSIKNVKKIIVAVALTLAVTFSAGAWEDTTGMSMASSAQAGCIGGGGMGSGTGGGC